MSRPFSIAWRRPTLTGETPTTIGAEELNFRVRYGNGCDLFAIATKQIESVLSKLDNRCDIIQNVVKSSID